MATVVGAVPAALVSYEQACVEMDEELVGAARRVSAALADVAVDVAPYVSSCSSVAHDLDRLARDALSHDRRTGRVGRRFCDADATYAFDAWTSLEVVLFARSLVADGALPSFEGSSKGGLVDRLRADGHVSLAEELATLPASPESRESPAEKRGFWNGVWEGLTEGSFDAQAYADGWGNVGKLVGQLASGLAVYGDVRDAIAEYSRGNWVGGTWDLAGAVPYLGDALKVIGFGVEAVDVARDVDRLADAAHDATRVADDLAAAAGARRIQVEELRSPLVRGGGLSAHEAMGGHTLEDHVGVVPARLLERLRNDGTITGSTSFTDRATAEWAITETLAQNPDKIAKVMTGQKQKQYLFADFDEPVGYGYMRGSDELERFTRVRVIVLRSDGPAGFRIRTAQPVVRT